MYYFFKSYNFINIFNKYIYNKIINKDKYYAAYFLLEFFSSENRSSGRNFLTYICIQSCAQAIWQLFSTGFRYKVTAVVA